jgi:hypothetical protein
MASFSRRQIYTYRSHRLPFSHDESYDPNEHDPVEIQVIAHLDGRSTDRRMARKTHYTRDSIREGRHGFNVPSDRFAREDILGTPRKVTTKLTAEVDWPAHRDLRIGCHYFVRTVE